MMLFLATGVRLRAVVAVDASTPHTLPFWYFFDLAIQRVVLELHRID